MARFMQKISVQFIYEGCTPVCFMQTFHVIYVRGGHVALIPVRYNGMLNLSLL